MLLYLGQWERYASYRHSSPSSWLHSFFQAASVLPLFIIPVSTAGPTRQSPPSAVTRSGTSASVTGKQPAAVMMIVTYNTATAPVTWYCQMTAAHTRQRGLWRMNWCVQRHRMRFFLISLQQRSLLSWKNIKPIITIIFQKSSRFTADATWLQCSAVSAPDAFIGKQLTPERMTPLPGLCCWRCMRDGFQKPLHRCHLINFQNIPYETHMFQTDRHLLIWSSVMWVPHTFKIKIMMKHLTIQMFVHILLYNHILHLFV